MRILITGSGGFIGRHLTASLLVANNIIALYRNTKPNNLGLTPTGLKLVNLDLAESLHGLEAVDVIIHTAAHTHLIPNSTASDYIRSNVNAMLNLASYARLVQPRIFVYLSTLSVYGEITVRELDEDTPLNKPEMYGLSKYMGEHILKEHLSYFPSVCIRLPGVVGPGYFMPWLGKMLLKASRNEPILIFNPDSLFNNVVDVLELHRFISWIIESSFVGFDVFNLAASEPMRIREVIDLTVSLTNSKSVIHEEDSQRQSFSIKTEKIGKLFGFEPETTKTIIGRYVTENLPFLR